MATVLLTSDAVREIEGLPVPIIARLDKLVERLRQWPAISGAKPLTGDLAGKCRLAPRLSGTFRRAAVEQVGHLPRNLSLFLNTHPSEIKEPGLLEELRWMRALLGDHHLVLEVHEDFAADTATLARLRDGMRNLGVHLAYDDFGAGQSRFAALAQVAPDYVKLDRAIVQNLPHCRAMRDLVRALCTVCLELGCQTLAEGIESEDEAALCRELGCQLGQGFLFGCARPAALAPGSGRKQRLD